MSRSIEMIERVTQQLLISTELPEVLDAIAQALVDLGATLATLHMYVTDTECLFCQQGPPPDPPMPRERALHRWAAAGKDPGRPHRQPIAGTVSGLAIERREPIVLDDLRGDPRSAHHREEIVRNDLRWGAIYPLQVGADVMGALGVGSSTGLPDEVLHVLEVFASQTALAIRSSQLLGEMAARRSRLLAERDLLRAQAWSERSDAIVGTSAVMRSLLAQAAQVAAGDTSVLITGETGTGKDLVARALHRWSGRASGPLITVNCGAIQSTLAESELFGHERGAFTGAVQRRIGRFELAHQGTLFLDEVTDLPPDIQVKLLRVLEEKELVRVGGTRPVPVDVRLVAATNRDLAREVESGRFRSDLFYRLNVFPLRVPSLRERPEDIPDLVRHFMEELERRLGKPLRELGPRSLEAMQRYPWPGNVRELQNVLERSCVRARGPVIEVDELLHDPPLRDPHGGTATLHDLERAHVLEALEAARGRIAGPRGAAAALGLHPNTLRSRMQRLGVAYRA